jgi:phenylalanyl-tRNA synthetase beta subunit
MGCMSSAWIADYAQTQQIRSLCSGVILRGITFTKERYESFIALQDKLHSNLARQRTLVSIGTHDLDSGCTSRDIHAWLLI